MKKFIKSSLVIFVMVGCCVILLPILLLNIWELSWDNYKILLENNATKYLEVGDSVTFITAPRYFGNGYMVPIVELRSDTQIYLAYEEGYENLLESYQLFH